MDFHTSLLLCQKCIFLSAPLVTNSYSLSLAEFLKPNCTIVYDLSDCFVSPVVRAGLANRAQATTRTLEDASCYIACPAPSSRGPERTKNTWSWSLSLVVLVACISTSFFFFSPFLLWYLEWNYCHFNFCSMREKRYLSFQMYYVSNIKDISYCVFHISWLFLFIELTL